jgi:cysteine desulfurase
LREKLAEILGSAIPDVIINGGASGSSPNEHLPGVLSVTFPGTEGDSLLLMLDNVGISTSTGSACSAGVQRTSHVLLSIGLSENLARGSLRFSLGRTTTEEEINRVGEVISDIVAKARLAYSAGAKNIGVNS